MFGLPTTTTLIIGGVMAFWVIYTLVFYFSTSNWAVEDADYAPSSEEDDAGTVSPRAGGGDS
ncbi:hypothetical protein [Nesterenkonia natronophila]|uniref:Uncharacterized protein n=1 Tax=Nesterenkonia natronophila TaxID=2174932 RepID=A0A3A4F9Y3_9MICC|nr:hypothetical protein [Nesterenkonia natronophila]RJN31967.1 hypothetical protein D3250_07635 [Nesterenkonia natronophila]